jgi:hypothetical protein
MLDPVRIRFRTDAMFKAADASRLARGLGTLWLKREEIGDVEPARPGDIWRVRWMETLDDRAAGRQGPIAGYDICCPKCLEVHSWTTASNCAQRSGDTCAHSGKGSCWTWTGKPEDGSLSASPSLHASRACGWHGYLTNGLLKHC